jgi:hypothetical protein
MLKLSRFQVQNAGHSIPFQVREAKVEALECFAGLNDATNSLSVHVNSILKISLLHCFKLQSLYHRKCDLLSRKKSGRNNEVVQVDLKLIDPVVPCTEGSQGLHGEGEIVANHSLEDLIPKGAYEAT